MKIFERNGKINFVDDNNVFVGFDNTQSCCEDFGWLVSRQRPATIGELSLITELYGDDFPGYQFDITYSNVNETGYDTETSMVSFRLTNGTDELYVTLHNTHNGYYAHGYNMANNGTTICAGDL